MKKIHRVLAMLMAAIMALSLITTAFAEPIIDTSRKASLSIYKYDITKAGNDGAWDTESYVSTGLHDDAVVDKLSKYAIQGVEFTYLRIADITMNNELADGQRQVGVLYGFDNSDRSTAVLSAIGLTGADAHKTEGGINYFTSDVLNNKLSTALTANATTVKNALEAAVKNGGVAMTETDATGHASADQLEQELYLVVETRVPENVTSTCNPFFVSLPMTTIDGAAWNYDVTVYPKNQTGNPTLDKTVREAKNSTDKNTGSLTDIKDGYTHTASASIGDTADYQIISTLPTITSKASGLSEYTYVDTMSKGIRYNKNDVVIEFFKDAGCTDKIATWAENSGKFTVGYDDAANTMTIKMTEAGLNEINEAATVYTDSVKRGYSDCTMRITYAATLTADAKMGDTDNPNEVVLTWKRTNTTYFDMLLGRDGQGIIPIVKKEPEPREPKPFTLPEAYLNMRRLYAYLTTHRRIDRDVVTEFVREKLLYEDAAHHNCVFVGKDEHGEAKHAHLRSTNSQGKVFRINVEGSEAKHSFHKNGTDCSLYVFEAPIDLLSHITLYPAGWLEHSYVACCGTSVQPVLERLRQNPRLNMVYLCLDNDEAGEDACENMMEVLEEMDVDVERLRPQGKDWNDDLCAKRGGHG